jgi:hypothetical protein
MKAGDAMRERTLMPIQMEYVNGSFIRRLGASIPPFVLTQAWKVVL